MANNKVRGLRYEPSYEDEVVLLFGLLIPHLRDDFLIDQYLGSFPDCIVKRNGEEIGVEFEVLASEFFSHRHDEHPNLFKCKLLICWENDLVEKTIIKDQKQFLTVNEHEIEVMSLDKVVKELREEKNITIIAEGKNPVWVKWISRNFLSS